MTDTSTPALPVPTLPRWQPLRLGLVELFHYDSEEFWFRDGHLLLRGNNGTGKSKVLSLTLPFLFDAQLKPSRIEPDGDSSKKMAWNLLLGRHDRRMGYAWLELGRIGADGEPQYLTLGCGLLAVAARSQVDSWFFTLDQQRVGQDVWLVSPTRVVLTRDRLRDALQDHGQVYETATAYRRAVDERLFHLGQTRYAALMDTLIQLRQPQLSKKPDEASLSNALTEALPPISVELLADVADALNQLEEYRRELDEYEALENAVGQFNQRYQRYAATQARRRARHLRSAQTGFDNASREVNEGRIALEDARAREEAALHAWQQAELALSGRRAQVDALQNDPTMDAAKALDKAAVDSDQRAREADDARNEHRHRLARLEQEQQATQLRARRVDETESVLQEVRIHTAAAARAAGLVETFAENPLSHDDVTTLASGALDAAQQVLRSTTGSRREQVAHLRRRCDAAEQATVARDRAQDLRDERADDADEAAGERTRADAEVEQQGRQSLDAWQHHLEHARQLRVPDSADVLDALADWTARMEGDNPARLALQHAQQAASVRLARHQAELQARHQALQQEHAALQDERTRLQAGEDATPPPRAWWDAHARDGRAGAPLWQLVEFAPSVTEHKQAGLEAALQASGLLDAWVTPDGQLQQASGTTLPHDTFWCARPPRDASLAAWLRPSVAPDTPVAVSPATLQHLLEGVACTPRDVPDADTWVSPEGRFRLGTLTGAWSKPRAEFIGYAARAAARARRIGDIDARLLALAEAIAALATAFEQLDADQRQAASEWQRAPSDDALRAAHLQAIGRARDFETARTRLEQAQASLVSAVQHWEAARQALAQDASDLALPPTRAALGTLDEALSAFGDSLHTLVSAARMGHEALNEHRLQVARERRAHADADHAAEQSAERDMLAEEARVRLQTLRASVGAQVEELQQRMREAREAVARADADVRVCNDALRQAGEQRARADQKLEAADAILAERVETRQQAVAQWQGFAATGLLDIVLPDTEQPPHTAPWSIDAALALARRAEQALQQVKDDDEAWTRVQNQVSQDYTELGRALAALSHRAQAETSDFGLIVTIVYQNRPERPDQLGARLAGEIAQRRELLTAGERQVLENHLQAEIASAIHKLLHEAEQQVLAINRELEKRPTSTGVRFRLQWETLPEGGDGGAPVGLKAARERLLNTSTDLWSAEDRRVVGEMLQQRIAAERSRADAEQGGSLHEQLARALDYRRWHRFRVQRWDGQWRPLSGPASSGERALGLTVPLFAAVSSYYSQAGHAHAPRLVLLDEVFAGIDDAARHHCWALIREFDLDFVVTSEREWACSAELPGVAIAQLQRHEGIDAVHVSRWYWDGHAKRQVPDPDRRFPPAQ